ncbi:MAG: hypothetical protein TREMPRED_000160 [Tremellales sp. Tagirdzhanova-0007]|nr:MAG: hypothetical protein TREMPRED_000160 [Tremellales sp. Tagirdzhanova-0007]
MKARMNVASTTVDLAVQKFNHVARGSNTSPRSRLLKQRCILAVLDKVSYRAKHNSANLSSKWHIRWRDRKRIREEWLERGKMTKIFGSEDAKEAVKSFMEARLVAQENTVVPMSEYEIERLRRIEENKELMRQLGF